MKNAAEHLQMLLQRAVRKCVSDAQEVAIAFSGGLDSGMLAFLAKKCGIKPYLITVGLENTSETAFAEQAAHALDLSIRVQTYSIKDVDETLVKAMRLIKDDNAINVAIAIPFFWTAQVAANAGLKVLLAGQGADELFGGYHRYLSIYEEKGEEGLQQVLRNDFVNYQESGFRRDSSVCSFHGVDLRLPYTDTLLANFALSLPVSLKIESSKDMFRKKVLRRTAERMGLPSFIANRPKKAVQYATGVDKALRRLARKENLGTSDYCRKLFTQTALQT